MWGVGFVKEAWKWNKPGFLEKRVRRFGPKDMASAVLRNASGRRRLHKELKGVKGARRFGRLRGEVSRTRSMYARVSKGHGAGAMGGTVYETPKGTAIAIDKTMKREGVKGMTRRSAIGHEAYHATPGGPAFSQNGRSEVAAHVAGAAAAGGKKSDLRAARDAFLNRGGAAVREMKGQSHIPGKDRVMAETDRLMKGTGNERLARRYLSRAYKAMREMDY